MTPSLKEFLCRSVAALAFLTGGAAFAQTTLLNVSYDVSRELYKEINPAFSAAWKKQSGADVTVNQSHGGSSKQAGAVIGGLEADVITMNQLPDIDILVERALGIELKSTERYNPLYPKQLLTYLRLMDLPLGLLMNFGQETFKQGIKRVVNNHRETS